MIFALVLSFQLLVLYRLSEKFKTAQFNSLGLKAALFLSAPGVIIHELSHYLACLITFTGVKKEWKYFQQELKEEYRLVPLPFQ